MILKRKVIHQFRDLNIAFHDALKHLSGVETDTTGALYKNLDIVLYYTVMTAFSSKKIETNKLVNTLFEEWSDR